MDGTAGRDGQERQDALGAAREDAQRLRFALEAAGVGEWDLDLRTGAATRSLTHDRIFGYASPLPEWTVEIFLEHVHPDDRDRVTAAFRDAVASGREWDFECRIRRADGHERCIWARGGHRPDAEGRPARLTGLVRDVTDRRRAEEALRSSEAKYRTLFDAIDQGFCILQLIFDADRRPVDYRFTEVNPAFERHTGLTGALGRTARELVPGLEEHWFEVYGRVALTGAPTRFVDHSEPMRRWFDVYAFRVGAPEERRVALLFDDITERKHLEEQLATINLDLERRVQERTRELQARHRALEAFAAFTDAVGTETALPALAERAIAVVSASVGEDLRSVHWELEGGTWKGRAWSGNHRPETIELFRHGIPEDTPTHREIMATPEVVFFDGWTPDPQYRGAAEGYPAAAGVRLVSDGHPPAILGFALRSSDRWSDDARAVLRSVTRALLIAVQRGRDAARLAEQKAELEARNAEQETFVYTVSHDLRAPLLSIQGMAELLREAVRAGDAEDAGFFLERVSRNVERMGRLLDDLLALSRAGRDLQPPEPLDLRDALRAVLTELEPRIKGRRAAIHERLTGCPRLLYPRVEAEQVLANLLSNALKFAGRPGEPPRVRVTCEPAGAFVTVRVEDNGPGIAPAHRERVFGLFQRLDASAEGTGVGLAIVKRVVERHGGSVRLTESSLGGACFEVTMPAAG